MSDREQAGIDFSVIIVNYNGGSMLIDCVNSVLGQEGQDFETIVLDNGSSDGSCDAVGRIPGVKVIMEKENLGFAGGNNEAVRQANGKYLLLLNNDATLDPGCLESLAEGFDEYRGAGLLSPKILMMDDPTIINAVGAFWTSSTILYCYGYMKEEGRPEYNHTMTAFALGGPALCIRKEVIEKLGLFDPDFWNFYEEIDLCHRLWISGYECRYYPAALVRHAKAATASSLPISLVRYHDCRNGLTSMLKNFESRTLLTVIPVHLAVLVLKSLLWLRAGDFDSFKAVYRAIVYNVAHLPRTLRKRRQVQACRRMSDREVFARVKKNPEHKHYMMLMKGGYDSVEHLQPPDGSTGGWTT